MLNSDDLSALINYIFDAHGTHPTRPKKAVRYWDGKTPYGIHPTWCAMTLLTETALSEEVRRFGAQALLLHDVLEDTTQKLPADVVRTPAVLELVLEMTFESSAEEMEEVWGRSAECRLLKLYDKVSNLMDGSWMSAEKRAQYVAYTLRLADDVEANFGPDLNILKIARAICA